MQDKSGLVTQQMSPNTNKGPAGSMIDPDWSTSETVRAPVIQMKAR